MNCLLTRAGGAARCANTERPLSQSSREGPQWPAFNIASSYTMATVRPLGCAQQREAEMTILERYADVLGDELIAICKSNEAVVAASAWRPAKPDSYEDEAFRKHAAWRPRRVR